MKRISVREGEMGREGEGGDLAGGKRGVGWLVE